MNDEKNPDAKLEHHSRDTGKINIHIKEAMSALDRLAIGSASVEEKQADIDTLRLSLQIASHKALRIQELEAEIVKLKKQIEIVSAVKDLTGT